MFINIKGLNPPQSPIQSDDMVLVYNQEYRASISTTTQPQPQIPTFKDFLDQINLGTCYKELVKAGFTEDMFNQFIKIDKNIIREYIGKLPPLNVIQQAAFEDGILKLKESLMPVSHKRYPEEDNEIRKRSKHTITSALDIAARVLATAEINSKFFFDRFQNNTDILGGLDLSSEDLRILCQCKSDTQKKFNAFFSKMPQDPWIIHDSSSQTYFKDPIAKIDLAILDGATPSWPQLVAAIELKFSIGDKGDTSGKNPPDEHHNAIGQLADKFSNIFDQQEDRKEVFGAIAKGFDRLAHAGEVGDRTARNKAIVKSSTSDGERNILHELACFKIEFIPKVYFYGTFENGQRFIVIKPYGEHLEISKHGLRVVLGAIRDVAEAMKLASQHNILHRDIKPSNIILFNGHGYLIDWGIALHSNSGESKDLSATLLYCSISIMECLIAQKSYLYTLDDDVESLFYTVVDILCDGITTWNKGIHAEDIMAHKLVMIYHKFEKQLKYAPLKYYAILEEFRSLLFDKSDRSIDQVIEFLSAKIKESEELGIA
ncbi:10779_t:CDS:10 [Paraglomus brasilianum]|uniref:non-specific serine/threonine protein kinase n=1 Tax=Paraglomus brasilianum TaxID=144538 RepID=A0A9N8ZQJ7_9GLOM|nr:10779_t:CDS:10 [Paraglomus brasilianum]